MNDDAVARLEVFAEKRSQAALSPQGFLSLINTQWVSEPTDVWGAAGRWAPRPDGGSGLVVTADPDDEVTVDGVVVDGDVIVRGKDDPEPSVIQFSETVTGTVIAGDSGYGLRVFDQKSEYKCTFSNIYLQIVYTKK